MNNVSHHIDNRISWTYATSQNSLLRQLSIQHRLVFGDQRFHLVRDICTIETNELIREIVDGAKQIRYTVIR